MKKTLSKIAVLMALILLILALAGCNNNNNPNNPGLGDLGQMPEFVFVPEFINLPDGLDSIQNLVYANGQLYFTSWQQIDDNHISTLFSMNLDGTNIRQLENFTTTEAPEGAEGSANINALHVDGDGNLWVAETGSFWGFNLPANWVGEEYERWEFSYEVGRVMLVRKLDNTGAEILSIDISDIGGEHFWLSAFNMDNDGNIYIVGDSMMGAIVHVLNSEGQPLFTLEPDGWVQQLIRLSDSAVATAGWGQRGFVLQTIDFTARAWGKEIELPFNAHNVFSGGGEYSLVFSDSSGLFGIDDETGESIRLLNWIDSDIHMSGSSNIVILADGRIVCTTQDWNHRTGDMSSELIILTKVPFDSLPPRTIITFATFGLDWQLRSAIVNFNRTSTTHRIQVTDYLEFSNEDDWQAGLTRLTTEIISGRVPDMLGVNGLPIEQYVARGLLSDLYAFIDADLTLNRSDFIENILRVAEIDGGLYQVFPSFGIQTWVGHPEVLGTHPGWNMSEFKDIIRANPQADYPLGQFMSRERFLGEAIRTNMDYFIDWSTGTVNFESDEFIQLLEFAIMFPENEDMDFDWESWIEPGELIASGRQLVTQTWIGDFRSIQWDMAMLGDNLVYKGFPAANRNGHTLSLGSGIAITSRASDPDGAWSFLRTILTEDWQRDNVSWNFPINKVVFNEMLEEATTPPEIYIDEDGNEIEIPRSGGSAVVTRSIGGGGMISTMMPGERATTQEEADLILALIDSVSGTFSHNQSLLDIVEEGAADFFSGRRSAEDAARVIQSRVSIFVAEQR